MKRGFTLIESMVSLAILAIAIAGLFQLQVFGVALNRMSGQTLQATNLGLDMEENINRWTFNDPRLTPLATVPTPNDPAVKATWDMGPDKVALVKAEYGDQPSDSNAGTSSALQLGLWQGLPSPQDGLTYTRYWNVYYVSNPGVAQAPIGKLVQVIVRWRDGLGHYHQVAMVTFKRDPKSFFAP